MAVAEGERSNQPVPEVKTRHGKPEVPTIGRREAVEGRVPELDGIRGIAILLVLVCHWGSPAATSVWAKEALGPGWAGVDLFFVLSGFLISGILIDSKGSPGYFRRFYFRRAFRIFPIYYLYLLLYFHSAALSNGALGGDLAAHSGGGWYWLYLSNWRVDSFHGLRHFWSLAIEEQFYMVWPLIVMLTPRTRLKYVAAACIVVSPSLRLLFASMRIPVIYLYQTTPFRLEGLAAGALLAIAVRDPELHNQLRRLPRFLCPGAALTLAVIVVRYGTSALTRPMAVAGFLCVTLLWATLVFRATSLFGSDARSARFLRSPWLVSFGKYSYGLYVWHFPIAREAGEVIARVAAHSQGWLRVVLLPASVIVGIAISYAAAWVSWKVIERPMAQIRDWLSTGYWPFAVGSNQVSAPAGSARLR